MAKSSKPMTDAEKAAKLKAKRDKFEELGAKRMTNAIKQIANVGNLANKSSYQFEAADVDKIEKALDAEVARVVNRFRAALEGKKAEPTGFTF